MSTEFKLDKITKELFDTTAEKIAKDIVDNDKKTTKNQMRNFYELMLVQYEKSENLTVIEFDEQVLPFVRMINSKVAYSKGRLSNGIGKEFGDFITSSVNQTDSKEKLKNFKLLFEAVLGFYTFYASAKDKNNNNRRN